MKSLALCTLIASIAVCAPWPDREGDFHAETQHAIYPDVPKGTEPCRRTQTIRGVPTSFHFDVLYDESNQQDKGYITATLADGKRGIAVVSYGQDPIATQKAAERIEDAYYGRYFVSVEGCYQKGMFVADVEKK